MPFVGIILSVFIGYILGPLVLILAPLIIGLVLLYPFLKLFLFKSSSTLFKSSSRRKVKKILKERLKYLS
jgi:UDP-N-acetylmuramyl pentapeptide phosphotransferase/UDP-N-acetylglucosamine-1-phosphate transferase